MQAHQPQGGDAEPTTPRYDTIVIRGATGKNVPREVDGGEVVSWAVGHQLAALNALEEFVDDLADGSCSVASPATFAAAAALDLMRRRLVLGWDADKAADPAPVDWAKAINHALAKVRHVFEDANEEAMEAIEYMGALLLTMAPQPRWIPVTEAYPVNGSGTVAVLFDDGEPGVAWASYWSGARTDFAQWTFPVDELGEDRTVTHWAPLLPRPAKQGGEA